MVCQEKTGKGEEAMKRIISNICLSLFVLLSACDATIHQYPEEPGSADFVVQVNADRTPPLFYKEIVYDRSGNRYETILEEEASPVYLPNDLLALRCIVEVRDNSQLDAKGNPVIVVRKELNVDNDALPPQAEMCFTLPAEGDYTAVSWCDYVPVLSPVDWHFYTSTLDYIHVNMENVMQDLNHKNSATGFTRFHRDGEGNVSVHNSQDMNLSRNGDEDEGSASQILEGRNNLIPVYLNRPAGRLRLYTDDLEEFRKSGRNIEEVQVVIVYKQFISVAYDALDQNPCEWVSTRRIVTHPSVVNETGNVCLAYDYILVDSGEETHVVADFYFFDAEGNELAHTTNVDIPLWRNRETVVRSHFLTQSIGTGGLDIDEEFDDEYIVIVK